MATLAKRLRESKTETQAKEAFSSLVGRLSTQRFRQALNADGSSRIMRLWRPMLLLNAIVIANTTLLLLYTKPARTAYTEEAGLNELDVTVYFDARPWSPFTGAMWGARSASNLPPSPSLARLPSRTLCMQACSRPSARCSRSST